MPDFDPPGFATDLNDENKTLWSDWISERIDASAMGSAAENDGPRTRFFNSAKDPAGVDAQVVDIVWTAFPRLVRITSTSDRQRWKRADATRDNQDEYCEWSVQRDPRTQKIVRVTFTSEGPEYWETLAALQPDDVVRLYQDHVSARVRPSDIFVGGAYQARNPWNNSTDRGAMHLIQRANTLSAEIELAAAATIVRRTNEGRILTAPQELIACSRYGEPERNSDPHIGASVNALARQGAAITLANPVGLYIAGLSTAGWATPDGSDPAAYWKVTRGTTAKALRAVYEVPASHGFVVGDVTIQGRLIEFGAQIADFITIKLTGVATRIDPSKSVILDGCRRDAVLAIAEAPSVASILERSAARAGRRMP